MRTSAWVTILGLAGLAVACGDQPTEVVPEREGLRGGGTIALATSSSDDGLSITTDKDDYAPGDTVWFTGAGWPAEDTLDIVLTDSPTGDEHRWSAATDASGTFRDSSYVVNEGDLDVTFTLTATSRQSGRFLTVVFTDGNPNAFLVNTGQNPNPVTAGGAATYVIQMVYGGSIGLCTVNLSAAPAATPSWPAGATFSFSPASVTGKGSGGSAVSPLSTLTITTPATMASGTYQFTVSRALNEQSGEDCQGPATLASGPIPLVVTAANTAPAAPTSPGQFKSNGTTSIAVGGATNENSVVLKGTVTDPDAGNTVKLDVEVRLVGTPFTDTPTAASSAVATGGTASVAISGLADGSYHWQARAVDDGSVAGPWASFGGNAESATDFQVKTGRPSVSIDQASGQADPTNATTINFTAVFSEDVSGFTGSDVTLSGTAGAATAVVTGGPRTYNVAVTGMTGDGTVIASIPADVAEDVASNGNTASTSTDNTVTYDGTRPTVTINQAVGQADPTNASPITFTVIFSEDVADFATGDVSLGGTAGATTATVTGGPATYQVAVTGTSANGTVIASIGANVAHDAATNGNMASTSTDNTVAFDDTPPVVSDVVVSPSPTNGTVSITATAKVEDAATGGSDITKAEYRIDGGAAVLMSPADGAFDSPTENVTASIPASVVAALGNGSHTVCVRGAEAAGNTSSFAAAGACAPFIVDKVPPVVSSVAASPNPATGSAAVTLTASVSDASTGNSDIVSAGYSLDGGAAVAMTASAPPFDSPGEGVTATIGPPLTEGSHTLCVRGTDAAGNTSSFGAATACTTLIVDQTPPVISNFTVSPNPVAVNTPITIKATFTDALTKVASAQYSLGGTAGPWVTLPNNGGSYDSGTETGTAIISLANPDVLDVCVRSTDQVGNTNQPAPAANAVQCVFLAVYDPTAGFVTGGGWITSPAGAYPADPSLTGKATFGFVSKYLKGANVPTGNTEFQFHAGSLNFSSTVYDWLVVSQNGARAQYKGYGTVNGQGGYGFLLTALDQSTDLFRIKIWNTATGAVAYDNQLGSSDTGDDATALGGGSIIIHVPRK